MGDVRILPESLSNRIAAGEVVERPVSVVKELMENALDAGATRIVVEIERGGRDLIRVSDNGSGMSRDNALLAIERYATSKLHGDSDLFSIKTFGFRGEALPSMASVSRFTLVTRPRSQAGGSSKPPDTLAGDGAEDGSVRDSSFQGSRSPALLNGASKSQDAGIATRIHIQGGTLRDVSDTGAPPGTMVEVRNLYFNTPARRKFLKSVNTEMGHIADTFSGMALGNPGVHFSLRHNGRDVRRFSASSGMKIRAGEVLGKESLPHLLKLDSGVGDSIRVTGYIASPDITRSTSQKIRLFVNNRMVTDKGLVAALFRGFHGRIMKGRYPVALVFVALPFDQVDVNVHPAKLQVRFQNPREVYSRVVRAVEGALSESEKKIPGIRSPGTKPLLETASEKFRPDLKSGDTPGETGDFREPRHPPFAWARPSKIQEEPLGLGGSDSGEKQFARRSDPRDGKTVFARNGQTDQRAAHEDQICQNSGGYDCGHTEIPEDVGVLRVDRGVESQPLPEISLRNREARDIGVGAMDGTGEFRILGQIMNTYVVLETREELVLLDQHAAHERIVFETLKGRAQTFRPPSQTLLVPETLELGFREAELLERIIPDLAPMGLVIEPFGETTFVIKAVPALLDNRSVKEMVLDMVEQILESGSGSGARVEKEKMVDDLLVLMACHSAIRAGQRLSIPEMEKLVRDLDRCDKPMHCPHGRPIRVHWDARALEKMFKRVL